MQERYKSISGKNEILVTDRKAPYLNLLSSNFQTLPAILFDAIDMLTSYQVILNTCLGATKHAFLGNAIFGLIPILHSALEFVRLRYAWFYRIKCLVAPLLRSGRHIRPSGL